MKFENESTTLFLGGTGCVSEIILSRKYLRSGKKANATTQLYKNDDDDDDDDDDNDNDNDDKEEEDAKTR